MTLALAESELGSCHIASRVPEHLLSGISRLLTLWRQGATFTFFIPWELKASNHFSLFLYSPTYFPHPLTSHHGKYLLEMQLTSSLPEISPCNHIPLCEWKRNTSLVSMGCGSVRRGRKTQGWKQEGFFKIKNSTQIQIHFQKPNS